MVREVAAAFGAVDVLWSTPPSASPWSPSQYPWEAFEASWSGDQVGLPLLPRGPPPWSSAAGLHRCVSSGLSATPLRLLGPLHAQVRLDARQVAGARARPTRVRVNVVALGLTPHRRHAGWPEEVKAGTARATRWGGTASPRDVAGHVLAATIRFVTAPTCGSGGIHTMITASCQLSASPPPATKTGAGCWKADSDS